jgi:cytochrome b pre-mRNA-processing protein 3
MMRLFRRGSGQASIDALYGAIVAQARHPAFYRAYGVPDSVEGRFDMIVLHLWLVLRRLRQEAETRSLGQAVFDLFCRDMDANLREMGVGDLAVPKQMRNIGEAFYGRAGSYDRAIAQDARALAEALGKNVFGTATALTTAGVRRLAAYVYEAGRRLETLEPAQLTPAILDFPDPDTISIPEPFPVTE